MLDRFRLEDRIAVVTGAGRGIGAAIALALADAGADVALLARTIEELEDIAGKVRDRGRRAIVAPTDVMDSSALERSVERTLEDLGGIDIVVNNAGGTLAVPFMETRGDHLEWAFRFNVSAPVELALMAVPHMLARGGGTILNIGSMSGVHASGGYLPYGTAKAALAHATRLMASNLAPQIRVNAVLPGAVETPALNTILDDMEQKGTPVRDTMRERTLLRRMGAPDDIAAAALFLVSDSASWITGKLLEVDGGWSFELLPRSSPEP